MRTIGLPELIAVLAVGLVLAWAGWSILQKLISHSVPPLGSRQCPHCGQRIPDVGGFCAICGQKIV